jgi:hypothetical protein
VRGRIRELPNGRFAVYWQASRHCATREEAEEMPALSRFICQLRASGMSPRLISALLIEGWTQHTGSGSAASSTVNP